MGKACSKPKNEKPHSANIKTTIEPGIVQPHNSFFEPKIQNPSNIVQEVNSSSNIDSTIHPKEFDSIRENPKDHYYFSKVLCNDLKKREETFHSLIVQFETEPHPMLLALFKAFVTRKCTLRMDSEKIDYFGFFEFEKPKKEILSILQTILNEDSLKMHYEPFLPSYNASYQVPFDLSTLHYFSSNVSKSIIQMTITFIDEIVIENDPKEVQNHLSKYNKWIEHHISHEFHDKSKSQLYLLGYKLKNYQKLKLFYYFANLNEPEFTIIYNKLVSEIEPFLVAHSKNISHASAKKKNLLDSFRIHESDLIVPRNFSELHHEEWIEVYVNKKIVDNPYIESNATLVFVAPFHTSDDYVYEYIAKGHDISPFKGHHPEKACGLGVIATDNAFGFTTKSGVQIRPILVNEESVWMLFLLKCKVAPEAIRIPHTFNNFMIINNPEFMSVESILYRPISENQALNLMS